MPTEERGAPEPHSPASAEDLFAEWLARSAGADDPAGLDALVREHPAHAAELRVLHENWGKLHEILAKAGLGIGAEHAHSFAARLKERYGSDVDPAISLEEKHDRELPSSELLRRLAEKTLTRSRYQMKGELARGGMGAILKIWDEDLRRSLAMKVILGKGEPAEGGTPPVDRRLLARFLEEAQVTGQLDHPGIVPVHELGLDSEGRVFFTMKLVKGRDLKAIFDLVFEQHADWNETRALGVLLKVCEAMAYAHAKGVVHRDLKPANVMVGSFGEVYVMDWGLARVLGRKDAHDLRLRDAGTYSTSVETERRREREEAPDSPLFTMDGDIVGTPAYMPPEQAKGQIERLSPRSDVYALGAMLYHLLARRIPYVPPDARITNRMVLAMVVQGAPAPLATIRQDVPAELNAIVERAMMREPEERYRDTLELADDLRAYLEHRVVKAYQTGALAELKKWVERNRALAASAAAAVLLLVAGLTASLIFKARSDRNATLARESEERAKQNEQRALAGETLAKRNEEEARAEKERADREADAATRRADEVLRLSALQKLDDLTAEADRLWPAIPENVKKYEDWLRKARELVAELQDHERTLAELRAKSVPWTEEDQARHRAEHPKLAELESARRHVEHHEKLRAALESSAPLRDPTPEEVGVDLASLPATADDVNGLAWDLIDPDRKDWGGEAKGLVLARRAVELAEQLSPAERAGKRDSLAWALFANGRFDEAVAEEELALEEAAPDRKQEFEGYVERLKKKIEEEIDPEQDQERVKHVSELEQRIAALEAEISKRPEWLFADAQDKWWHNQLEKLVGGLKTFSAPETGLASSGISAEHGWGVEKRVEFARTIAERSVSSPEASTVWTETIATIANSSESPGYGGLRITPQLGLLPIGRDPLSGLWEFSHLQTGEPAARGPDGKLILTEATGLVFVLLPGGTYTRGAQRNDPAGPNYDPEAQPDEGPPREVRVPPFFLSKYEMTQGQWLRFAGTNPSRDDPQAYSRSWNAAGKPGDLLHPVEQVSWTDSAALLERLGLELPREAQWEYGARAGTTTVWWCGDEKESIVTAGNLADLYAKDHGGSAWGAWEDWDDGNTSHARVGSYAPNAFGLHDVIGNLWEWCEDLYTSGSADRVNRGGGFNALAVNARSALRLDGAPSSADALLGLRPARALLAP